MDYMHLPVLPAETIAALDIKPDGIYVDCTLGGCGHTKLILNSLGADGRVIGFDRDADAINNARIAVTDQRLTVVHSHFIYAADRLSEMGIDRVDGVLFDLGVSSHQLDTAERGFSYRFDAPLDMRMDVGDTKTAFDVVNGYSCRDIERILRDYGEEKYARRIAERICSVRQSKPIATTLELAAVVADAVPAKYRLEGGSPAKRTFQAIRIEVNGELETLAGSICNMFDKLSKGGRMAIITFHSLEDRIVKNTFASFVDPCTCPKDFPCVCGKKPIGRLAFKGSVTASDEELKANKRSHSARLRAAERL